MKRELKIWGGPIVITEQYAVDSVAAYMEVEPNFQTFNGLLCFIGLTPKKFAVATGAGVEMLLTYKFALEVEMEKVLRFQAEGKGFNYTVIEGLLKKSNPEHWGDKTVIVEKTNNTMKFKDDLRNSSGYSLSGKNKC